MNIIKSELSVKNYPHKSVIELLLDRLEADLEKGCIIDCIQNKKWNKSQVLESSLNFAYYLMTECEVKKEDIILFVKSNSDSHAIAIIGVLAAGAVYCSIPGFSTEREINDVCANIKPAMIICPSQKYEEVKIATINTSVKKILLIDEQIDENINEKNGLTFDKVFNTQRAPNSGIPRASDLDDTIIITMTSGSTGRPKSIQRTNRMLLAELVAMNHSQTFRLTEDDIFYSGGLCHSCGQSIWLACINTGAQMAVIPVDEDHKQTFEAIHEHNITHIFVVPTQLNFLSRNSDVYNKTYIKSLRNVLCGGAHLSEATYNSLVNTFNLDSLRTTYGMSEIGFSLVVYKRDAKSLQNVNTIGKLFPGFEAKIIDQNGNSLGPNQPGELCFKGDQITPGYLNNEEENYKLFTKDHFLKSGDICYYDEHGFIYLIGRSKEIINVEGVLVAPAELESILIQNEEIENAAVIGVKDEEFDEIPLAFVKLIKGSSLTHVQIQQFVDDQVSHFKKLRGGVRIVERFPLTQLKKINKTELKKTIINSI